MNATASTARSALRGGAERIWLRRLGLVAVALSIAIALLVILLRVVLAGMPERAGRVAAWVERQTQLRLEFSRLDARLRWYGPELVLYDLRILDRESRQPMLAMREGTVALDLWNVLRAGEFVAGRVSFVGPSVTVLRLPDGSIRLLGLGERPADRPPFDFDRLPAGHVQITDATVHVRNLGAHPARWTVSDLALVLRRDRDRVVTRGSARLPESLGGRIAFEGELDGTLAQPRDLAGRVDVEADKVVLRGFATLLPRGVARPVAGTGRVNARIEFADRRLTALRVGLGLRELAVAPPPRSVPAVEVLDLAPARRAPDRSPLSIPMVDKRWRRKAAALPAVVKYDALDGEFDLRRMQDGWTFDLRDLRVAPSGRSARTAGQIRGEFRGRPVSRYSFALEARALRVDDLWPLAVALAPHSADRWLALVPRGEIRRLSFALERPRAGALPVFRIDADVADLGVAASGRWPGLSGLTATIRGTDERGQIALRSPALEFGWPSMFETGPLRVTLGADLDWRREGRAWLVSGKNVALRHGDARAQGGFELRYSGRKESPLLRADAKVEQVDAALVRALLPYGRLKERATAWLKPAFVGGTAVDGVLHIDGPIERFPFRGGGGQFRAAFDVRDVTLEYLAGFAPLRQGSGHVLIENGGLRGDLRAGRVGGLAVHRGAVTIADLKAPVVDIEAAGSGDLRDALALLQRSPLGPVIGRQFMQLAGRGDTAFDVRLHLPVQDMASRDYEVHTRLERATVTAPLLRSPAQDVSGELVVRRQEIRASELRGNFLGGPFVVSIAPGDSAAADLESVAVEGRGRAAGSALPAFLGLPAGIAMSGGADWTLEINARRDGRGEPWPTQLAVASDLRGLAINAPPPFGKTEAEPRPTALSLDYAPARGTDVEVRSGAAHARLAFRDRDGQPQFERGAVRFDAAPLALPAQAGLHVYGDWPDFDLGQWLALGGDAPARRALSDWLGPVNVRLAHARLYGYELRDVAAVLHSSESHWQIDLDGRQVAGRITVPFAFRSGTPIVLNMRRLYLESAKSEGQAASAADATGAAVARPATADPRRVPALNVTAEDFVWQGRRLGRLQAEIVREPLGLRARRFSAVSPALEVVGSGRWIADGGGSRSEIDVEAVSSDLGAASVALGYRDAIDAKRAHFTAHLKWPGGPTAEAVRLLDGHVRVELEDGQLRNVEPGAAGRVLGLMSVVELPRRLALDFRDVTDEGLAFDSVRGDFEVRKGNAYTQNLLLSGAAVDIGVAGRTGLVSQDYDQTLIVSGNPGGPLTVAGALAAGPVVGAGVLVLSQLFKGQLKGLTRAYYRVTGPWSAPVVERISAPPEDAGTTQEAAASLTP